MVLKVTITAYSGMTLAPSVAVAQTAPALTVKPRAGRRPDLRLIERKP